MKLRRPLFFFSAFLGLLVCIPFCVIVYNDIGRTILQKQRDLPSIELKNFRYKALIQGDGVEVLGSLGYHFADKDTIENIKIHKQDGSRESNLSAKKAVSRKDIVTMRGNVEYTRNDGYILTCQAADYVNSQQLIKIVSDFTLRGQKILIHGKSSDIDLRKKTVVADTVNAKITY